MLEDMDEINFDVKDKKKYYRMIRAYINEKYVGYYRFKRIKYPPIIPSNEVMISRIESFFQNKGIPRALINKATKVLEDVAKSTKKTIEHHEELDKDSKIKLEHIFLEYNYIQIGEYNYVRIYSPD